MTDLANPALIEPALFLLICLLAAPIALLKAGHDRTKRSLALLVVLVASFAALRELLPLPLSSGLSLAVFLGLYLVFHLAGKFDSRE
jgi:hypothetical protein